MRKIKRKRDTAWAMEVFDKAPYVTMSMVRPDGTAYGIPLSLVRDGNYTFYFHCADEGEKIDCISANPLVSLSAVSRCTPKFEEETCNFTEYFQSAVALGKATIVDNEEEKVHALRLLCDRFLPKAMDHFDKAIARSLDRTTGVKISLTEPPVGKCKP